VTAGVSRLPKLNRVIETCLYVHEIDRASGFYAEVLGLPLMRGDARFRAFDVGGASVLLLFQRGATLEPVHLRDGTVPPHDGHGSLHIAFAVAPDELADWEKRLVEHGVAVESRVKWSGGGRSIYFRDPDSHLLELATPGLWPNY
jgi:catechol 2,3-dioxygenase-like lactoylglutathione lyase family enzyme